MRAGPFNGRAIVRRSRRAGGDYGVVQTLRRMVRHIRESAVDPAIVSLARDIVLPAGRRAIDEKIWLVRDWLSGHTKWVPDPLEAEYLVAPLALLDRIRASGIAAGDCDDIAMLGAALLRAVGIRTRLRAVSFAPFKNLQHVYTEAFDGLTWRELDVSRPARGGRPHNRALTMEV